MDPLRFLIVTSKLLTGFDAEVEGVLYLDKPLTRHTLFQAICRTNRRFTNPLTGQEKLHGLVVDYVGLGADIAQALRDADPERSVQSPVDLEEVTGEFLELLDELGIDASMGFDISGTTFEALMEAQARLSDARERDVFARDFLRLQGLWELLAPTSVTQAHAERYRWLAQVYELQPSGVRDALLWHRLGAKTLELVHGHMN